MQGVPHARDIPGCETRLRLRGLEALPNVCVLVLSPELERFVARISSCPVFVARFGDMATNAHPWVCVLRAQLVIIAEMGLKVGREEVKIRKSKISNTSGPDVIPNGSRVNRYCIGNESNCVKLEHSSDNGICQNADASSNVDKHLLP